MTVSKRFPVALASLALAAVAGADTERDLGSHEHGAARLDLVVDGARLFVDLESPWSNLVGFEHRPSSEAQRARVAEALGRLEDPAALFAIDGGDCRVAGTEIDDGTGGAMRAAAFGEAHGEEDEQHDDEAHGDEGDHHADEAHGDGEDHHADEAHADGEDRHGAEAHAEGEDHDHGEGETHSELRASYVFDCAEPAALSAIGLPLLAIWPGFESIAVQLAGPGGQTAATLTPEDDRLDLAGVL